MVRCSGWHSYNSESTQAVRTAIELIAEAKTAVSTTETGWFGSSWTPNQEATDGPKTPNLHAVSLNATHDIITHDRNPRKVKTRCSGFGKHYHDMYMNHTIYATALKRGDFASIDAIISRRSKTFKLLVGSIPTIGKLTMDPNVDGNVKLQWADGSGTSGYIKAARLRRVNGSEFRTAQQKLAVNTASFDSSD